MRERKQLRNALGRGLIFCIAYLGLAMFSLETRDAWSLSTSVWLPAGLVLGTICTSQRMYWPFIGITAGAMHVIASMLYSRSFDIALTFAVVDLCILFPLAIIWHNMSDHLGHFSYRNLTLLLLFGVYTTSLAGGVLSVVILKILQYPVLISHFSTWALSNATGCLAGAPFFIFRRHFKDAQKNINVSQFILLSFITIVFLMPSHFINSVILKQALLYLVLGGTLILAVSLSLQAVAVLLLYSTLLINLMSYLGYGPLAEEELQGMINSQLYLLAIISLGLIFASSEKDNVNRSEKYQQNMRLLFQSLESRKPVFFQMVPGKSRLNWTGSRSVFGISPDELSDTLLLQARILPEDREKFAQCLFLSQSTESHTRHVMFRLLLTDDRYHVVCCRIVYNHLLQETFGVMILKI